MPDNSGNMMFGHSIHVIIFSSQLHAGFSSSAQNCSKGIPIRESSELRTAMLRTGKSCDCTTLNVHRSSVLCSKQAHHIFNKDGFVYHSLCVGEEWIKYMNSHLLQIQQYEIIKVGCRIIMI